MVNAMIMKKVDVRTVDAKLETITITGVIWKYALNVVANYYPVIVHTQEKKASSLMGSPKSSFTEHLKNPMSHRLQKNKNNLLHIKLLSFWLFAA